MEHKSQHFVPRSYLEAWCDTRTPAGQTPYVWRHEKDGGEPERKAPRNIFCEPDYYTFFDATGNRNLFLEKYLSPIEGHFTRIRKIIRATAAFPNEEDVRILCLYVALMLNRTKDQKDNRLDFYRRALKRTVDVEKASNSDPTLSQQIEPYTKYGHHIAMVGDIQDIVGFLGRMSKALFFAEKGSFFITSDSPCFLFAPDAYRMPPYGRSPGFGWQTVELILPLSPFVLFLASWSDIQGPKLVRDNVVQCLNHRLRFWCHEYFITHDGVTQPFWFDPGKEPADSWENTQRKNSSKGTNGNIDSPQGATSG